VSKEYSVEAHGEYYPAGTRITFEFPAKGSRGPVKLIWHDGEFTIPQPEELTKEGRKVVGIGAVLIGDKGKIMHGSHGAGGWGIIPSSKAKDTKRPDESIPRIKDGNHYMDWLNAVRENRPACSPFEYGGALSEIGLLAMIAIRHHGTRLEWNAPAMKFANHEAANAMLTPAYRQGWEAKF